MLASATPVIRLVAPGPRVPRHAGRIAGEPPVRRGHERRALFMPREDEANLGRLFQRHHEVGILLAGNAEDVLDALFFEAPDEQVGRLHRLPSSAATHSSYQRGTPSRQALVHKGSHGNVAKTVPGACHDIPPPRFSTSTAARHVATVTLNKPERLNAIDQDDKVDLLDAIARIQIRRRYLGGDLDRRRTRVLQRRRSAGSTA